jgi:hypothetical protein|nr:MAG TPA: hypothetical protein [Caudoviricetes sp.]
MKEVLKLKGSTIISSITGQLRIEEGSGRLVIYDPINRRELVVLDGSGLLFSDGAYKRIKIGAYATRVGLWVSKEGKDVIELLEQA